MRPAALSVGYMPLVDAAPLIVAREMGFAAEEGLALDLVPAPSWSSLRDMLVFGQVDAAHMLAPVPVATALGLGGARAALSAIMVLSVNGNVVGVSNRLAARLGEIGHDFGFGDGRIAGGALIASAERRLRIGVPFPFSTHAELLYYWLSALGLPAPQEVDIRTVPPPLMAEAIEAGEIDAFCVGEPWGSVAVEMGVGSLLLPGKSIWSFAPEKVLAVRSDWPDSEPGLARSLVRALWRAGRWLEQPGNALLAAEMLSRPGYIDRPAEIIDRALTGNLIVSPQGDQRHVPGFVGFHAGAANFPWASQAQWIAHQLAARTGLDRTRAMARAGSVFRADVYRAALDDLGAEIPCAGTKIEGAAEVETPVAGTGGRVILQPNLFFDRRVFDVERITT